MERRELTLPGAWVVSERNPRNVKTAEGRFLCTCKYEAQALRIVEEHNNFLLAVQRAVEEMNYGLEQKHSETPTTVHGKVDTETPC